MIEKLDEICGPSECETAAEIQYAITRILRATRHAVRASGLTRRQYELLLMLKTFPGGAQPSIGDLAKRLGIRHHSAVGLADRLERRGLARRRRIRRQVILEATPKGATAVQAIVFAERQYLRTIAPALLIGITNSLTQLAPDPSGHARANSTGTDNPKTNLIAEPHLGLDSALEPNASRQPRARPSTQQPWITPSPA